MKRWILSILILLPLALPAQTIPTEADSTKAYTEAQVIAPADRNKSVDYAVLKYLQDHRTPWGDRLWLTISNSIVLAPVFPTGIAVDALCSKDQQTRETKLHNAGEVVFAELLNLGVTMGAKSIVRRPRPWVAYEGDLVCLQQVRSTSFPSGHTSIAFSAATSLTLVYPKWYVAVPAFTWAGAVGFSRMYVGAHYPSDVLAGALVGAGSAILMHFIRQKIWQESAIPIPSSAAVMPSIVLSF